jgi:hypothetical protein
MRTRIEFIEMLLHMTKPDIGLTALSRVSLNSNLTKKLEIQIQTK